MGSRQNGTFFGKKENSVENMKLPEFLQIFNDSLVATCVLMVVFFGTSMRIFGEDFLFLHC